VKCRCPLSRSHGRQPNGTGPPTIPNRLRPSRRLGRGPNAGLHFTESLLAVISAGGVQVCFLTLHVGVGTFAPVKTETIAAHIMHEERYGLGNETARAVNEAKSAGRRVIAVAPRPSACWRAWPRGRHSFQMPLVALRLPPAAVNADLHLSSV